MAATVEGSVSAVPATGSPKSKSVLLRVVTGSLLGLGLWALLVVAPAWAFHAVALVVIGIACWEFYTILEAGGSRPLKLLGVAGGLALVSTFSPINTFFDFRVPLVILIAAAPILAMLRKDEPAALLDSTIKTIFPAVFVATALGFLLETYGLGGGAGPNLLLLLFLCVTAGDTFAFFGGSRFGRHKMAPRLSPKKTWEGAVAGLLGAVGGAFLARAWVLPDLAVHDTVLLGLLLGVAAIFGDLVESLVKRANGVKDSSKLLPGHGGLLDRTDSLLFAAPLLYYYATMILKVGR